MADEQQQEPKQEPPPDRSPEAKQAAIEQLAADMVSAGDSFHFDTAYGILRGNPAFDANNPDERIFIINNWPAAQAKAKEEKKE